MAGNQFGDLAGSAVRVAGRGISGGSTTALRGGRFELGFAFSGGSALINDVYRGISKFPGINPGPGGPAQIKSRFGPAAIFGQNNVGDSVFPDTAENFRTGTFEGSLFSKVGNHIPFVNALAGFHDNLAGDQYLGKSLLTNIPTIPPSYALSVAGGVDQVWVAGANRSLSPLILNQINLR